MKTISIIVPIYNVARYLDKCLESFAVQLKEDWEVILVNDGSTDNSLEICKKFAEGRANVRILNKPNGGLSDARNAGTAVAEGEWIYYIDSDDWMADDAIDILYDFAVKQKCEVVQGGVYYAYKDHVLYDSRVNDMFILENEDAMKALIKNERVKNFAWGKLYKAELVKNLPFPKGKYFEDSYWQHLVMAQVKRYGIVSKPLYYYRQREGSISGAFSLRNMDLLKGYEERLEYIRQNYPNLESEMVKTYWKCLLQQHEIARQSSDEKVKNGYEEYWKIALDKYGETFKKYLKDDANWKLRECKVGLRVVGFIKRVIGHFKRGYYVSKAIE